MLQVESYEHNDLQTLICHAIVVEEVVEDAEEPVEVEVPLLPTKVVSEKEAWEVKRRIKAPGVRGARVLAARVARAQSPAKAVGATEALIN